MVVTQKMFSDAMDQVNKAFSELRAEIEELKSAKKPTVKPAEKKKS